MVKKIINIHHFTYEIFSEKDKGTIFNIYIDILKNTTLASDIMNNDFEILERRK